MIHVRLRFISSCPALQLIKSGLLRLSITCHLMTQQTVHDRLVSRGNCVHGLGDEMSSSRHQMMQLVELRGRERGSWTTHDVASVDWLNEVIRQRLFSDGLRLPIAFSLQLWLVESACLSLAFPFPLILYFCFCFVFQSMAFLIGWRLPKRQS